MSRFDELEDNLGPQGGGDDLFGDDDDDQEAYAPRTHPADDVAHEEDLEDDVGDHQGQQQQQRAGPGPGSTAQAAADALNPVDKRARLLALVQKKQQDAASTEDGGGKKKKKDKGGIEGGAGDAKRKKDRGANKPSDRPPRRRAGVEGGGNEDFLPSAEQGPQGSLDSRELKATDADQDFIDDDEVNQEGLEGEEAELARLTAAPQAHEVSEGEEADDAGEMLFGRKKKKRRGDDHNSMESVIQNIIAKMEAAADIDMDEHAQGRPAINKLKMLKEVTEFMGQRKYHELFIMHGGLGVLKAWLEPYSDGTLPNVRIRTCMLKASEALPIDTAREDIKESLKKSQLGSRIMFYARCPAECQANKKLATELVQRWTRPIFYDPEAEAEKRRVKEGSLLLARQLAQEAAQARDATKEAEEAAKKSIKFGQQGYRWRASIPQTMKLDFVVAPNAGVMAEAAASMQSSQGRGKEEKDSLQKKMQEVLRRQKNTKSRAAAPSVEGRGLLF